MIHINRFIDKVKFFESKNSKDFIIPLTEAKNLHTDITKLLLVIQEHQSHNNQMTQSSSDTSVDGGDW
jgi:hypothetical protein